MRRSIIILIAFLAIAAGLISCSKSSSTPSATIQMQADVFSLPWVSYDARATLKPGNSMQLDVTGDSTRARITLHIDDYRGPGTYIIPNNNNGATVSGAATDGTQKATSGKIVITGATPVGSSTTKLTGTFEFLAGIVPVQNGMFEVNIVLE